MPPLASDLRRVLENAVIAARDAATTAAAAALRRLAVVAKELPPYLTADERVLRQKLRAKARQLGDPWNADRQAFDTLEKLTHEVAYEHWHRMLFARFLAESNLLMHPQHGVHVDLATVADLAQEEAARTGAKADTWAMARRFAAGMLPQIFRPDDPALAVQLAPEHQQELERILESLPPATFTGEDSLGWVYQFWQSAEKQRVNDTVKAGAKITGATLPAVTQLFTEHYMVLFLLHNTVGAWWAGRQIANGEERITNAASESEARDAVALPDYAFEYLRFVQDDAGAWRPAAGTFEGWPKSAKDLRLLDPCCGSGHFLVAALELLTHLRMAEEGLDVKTAALAVIEENLFGLELDARCTQIAAFNVALAAWKLAGEHFDIPELHIACSGLGPAASLEQWLKIADQHSRAWTGIPQSARFTITNGLTGLHRLFSQAPELGSLLDPGELPSDLFAADWETLQPSLAAALESEKDDDAHERAVAAQGMSRAAEILAGEFALVITNVPYLGRGGQGDAIKAFCEKNYAEAKADLATVFLSRMLRWVGAGGSVAAVTPQNWLFLTSYRKLRERLLKERTWNVVARLGPGAFETIGGAVVNVALVVLSGGVPLATNTFCSIDALNARGPLQKSDILSDAGEKLVRLLTQSEQRANPDYIIATDLLDDVPLLEEYGFTSHGQGSFDAPRFEATYWELPLVSNGWVYRQSTADMPAPYAGCSKVFLWEDGNGQLAAFMAGKEREGYTSGKWRAGTQIWGKRGVLINQMSNLSCSIYLGQSFDENTCALVPNDGKHLLPMWCCCSADNFDSQVRKINQKVNVNTASLARVPFDLDHWERVASESYPNGLPEPQSDDPTQWLFHGHPAGRVPLTPESSPRLATALQVAVARLVGYRWPTELDQRMRLASEARAWVESCKNLERFADDDGVVPLVAINKEPPGVERVRALLEAAFGSTSGTEAGRYGWSHGLLNDLIAAAGSPGKSLDEWLKHEFWAQHCALFHQRPFIWQIWDGKKDGFNVLVHYHRLAEGHGRGRKLLEKITYTYLGDWITQQQAAARRGEPGADTRLKAAQDLQKKLEAIIAGEPPYDIFVRWKPLCEQPIGWDPDINDGVRMNIRPFVTASVLRGKVNVKWTKDRGKDPESIRPREQFPWFWSCPEDEPPEDFKGGAKFAGERLNDLHYTGKAKQAARVARESAGD